MSSDATGEAGFARRVTTLGSLADPVRRRLYRFVSEQPDAVSREQAADGVEVPRHTAKFHLDRLVDEGLLITEFRRLTGRSGPGAGRPAKLYRRSAKEVAVSLPSRRYDLAGQVLADAVERGLAGTPIDEALDAAAGAAASQAVDAASDANGSDLDRIAGALRPYGYEPRVEDDLVLANCPFDRIAGSHPDVVCAMNHAFVAGVVDGLGCGGLEAAREPGEEPDVSGCCVTVRARRPG
jgi:predicted ArsR family transcriptional regulator